MEVKKKKRGGNKNRNLEECYQKLHMAEASGDKFQIKIWKDIINRLESDKERERQY